MYRVGLSSIATVVLIGCSCNTSSRVDPVSTVANDVGIAGLYTDEEIRSRVGPTADAVPERKGDVLGYPCLDVVPTGQLMARKEVLRRLGLEQRRLLHPRTVTVHSVCFLAWQVSPSFDLICRTDLSEDVPGFGADRDDELDVFSPERLVYCITIVNRTHQLTTRWPLDAGVAGLYTDEEIRSRVGPTADAVPERKGDILGYPCLDVVPHGQAIARRDVLLRLGLEEGRLLHPRSVTVQGVSYLAWQVSPSFDLVCLTEPDRDEAIRGSAAVRSDERSNGADTLALSRLVHGIRVVSRAHKSTTWWPLVREDARGGQ